MGQSDNEWNVPDWRDPSVYQSSLDNGRIVEIRRQTGRRAHHAAPDARRPPRCRDARRLWWADKIDRRTPRLEADRGDRIKFGCGGSIRDLFDPADTGVFAARRIIRKAGDRSLGNEAQSTVRTDLESRHPIASRFPTPLIPKHSSFRAVVRSETCILAPG